MFHVYLIRDRSGVCKVGMARNIEKRIKTLQTGHPVKLWLVKSFPFESHSQARYVEHSIHVAYGKYRLKGEWFRKKFLRLFLEHLEMAGSIEYLLQKHWIFQGDIRRKKRKPKKGEYVIPNPGTDDDLVVNKI